MKIADIHIADGLHELYIQGRRFFLYKNKADVKLYDCICPHQGGSLHKNGEHICCEVHNWRFAPNSGESLNIKNMKLNSYRLFVDKNGDIFLDSKSVESIKNLAVSYTSDAKYNIAPPPY